MRFPCSESKPAAYRWVTGGTKPERRVKVEAKPERWVNVRGQGGATGHGRGQAGATGHGRGQTSGSNEIPIDSFLGLNIRRFTVATGYVATGFLTRTLLIGPVQLLFRRRNPVSSYLRRDARTWTAIFAVLHVIYGLQVHGRLRNFLDYFVLDGKPLTNSFGLGNWTGLAATVVVVGLLALSSDLALRDSKLGPGSGFSV